MFRGWNWMYKWLSHPILTVPWYIWRATKQRWFAGQVYCPPPSRNQMCSGRGLKTLRSCLSVMGLKTSLWNGETPDCTCRNLASAGAWPLGLVGSRRRIQQPSGEVSLYMPRLGLGSQVLVKICARLPSIPRLESILLATSHARGTLSSSFQLSWIWLHLSLVASWTSHEIKVTFIDSAFKSHALIFAFKMVFYNI